MNGNVTNNKDVKSHVCIYSSWFVVSVGFRVGGVSRAYTMMRFHIRFLIHVGCCYSDWFYVPLFNFDHPPLQTSLLGPAGAYKVITDSQHYTKRMLNYTVDGIIGNQFKLPQRHPAFSPTNHYSPVAISPELRIIYSK